jgi:hypothetical protein
MIRVSYHHRHHRHHRAARSTDCVEILSRADLWRCRAWQSAFANERKDHRYYELLEDTVRQGFDYRYFAIKDESGETRAAQPFFIHDQDLLAGLTPNARRLVDRIRRVWPRFFKMRTLMIGCVAGEAHLDGDATSFSSNACRLASAIMIHAQSLRTSLVVLKEYPAKYRQPLQCFVDRGFRRVPSFPMTILNIDYANFDEYMKRALNSATRTKLRRKFRAAAQAAPIELTVLDDISPLVEQAYPLYRQVYERSKFHFERLTEEYFCGLGRVMPEKVRFFVWRQEGRLVAFALCMIHGDAMYADYVGFDYSVALDLHLYHYAVRDMISWAMDAGYKWFRSSALNYDPKLHLRHRLDPVDLYVRHTSWIANAALKRILPLIEPTRYDRTLKKFPNYRELWE